MNKKEDVTNQDKALDFAKELIDEKGELLSSKIRKVSKDDKHFESWVGQEYGLKEGYSLSSISRLTNQILGLAQHPNFTHKKYENGYSNITSRPKLISKADDLIEKANRFIKTFKETPKTITQEEIDWTKLKPTHYAYFLYYRQNSHDKEPMIGRALVTLEPNGTIYFENTGADQSVNYIGNAEHYSKTTNKLYVINLNSDEDGRQLHIKLYSNGPKQKISVGLYTSYENGLIHGGEIVFQKLGAKHKKPRPAIFSSFIDNKRFKLEVDEEIRIFLSRRSDSYFMVRNTVKELKHLIGPHKAKNLHYAKPALFLEKEKPEIFISYPITGNKGYNEKLLETIHKNVENNFKEFNVGKCNKDEGHTQYLKPAPIDNLEKLKHTRVFILILSGVSEKISFSYIQLAWALIFCKQVIVVGKRKDISETIRHFDKNLIEFIYIKDEIKLAQPDSKEKEIDFRLNDEWYSKIIEKLKTFIYSSYHKP